MQLSPLTQRIAGKGAAAWGVHFAALQRRAAGEEIILLTVGDPDQAGPKIVVETAVEAMRAGKTGYSGILGLPELRTAVAERVERRTGVPTTMENITIVPGTQAGLYCTLQLIAGPGDEVIVPEPMYATYEAVTGATGATLVNVPLSSERGFHPDLDAIAAAVTPRTRAIWITSPHNPTGAVMTRAEVEAVAELCRRHDLWLVSDEVYEDLAYAHPHVSPRTLPGMAERTIVVSSLSKSHALPGFRTGWVIAPAALGPHFFNLILCLLYGGPPFTQLGAVAALRQDLPEVAAIREDYRRRAGMMSALLATAHRARPIPPEGGMFVMLDVRGTGLSAEDFARRLLESEAVAVLPCDGFGPSAVGHLRISLTEPDAVLKDAGERIVRFCRSLNSPL